MRHEKKKRTFDLNAIQDPSFVKTLTLSELQDLADQIRVFLIEHVAKTGGHLASNLGVVEITLAMYYVFDPDEAEDILFDTGHQSYVHKILTGRAKDFDTLRQTNGLSGFISREESKYDVWESGHSSTSLSAASGFLLADPKRRPVILIGDASLMNGVAFEGLNFLGYRRDYPANPIIILNDNKMSISNTVGAMASAFRRLRSNRFFLGQKTFLSKHSPGWIHHLGHQIIRSMKALVQQDNIFEDMGYDYYGPYNGHDIKLLIRLFKQAKKTHSPVLIHLLTQKGKGYEFSEKDTEHYHAVAPFDVSTGKPLQDESGMVSYSQAISRYLVEKRAKQDFFVITPAMKVGEALSEFEKKYPASCIDVGIAEEHAVDMAAGVALKGKDVVLFMYSTFAQRAYDEFLNDVCRQDLKVIIGIDHAGLIGGDGPTHQGIYDVSMFMSMPNVILTMPKDEQEAIGLFNYAFSQKHPFVIRYPKESVPASPLDYDYVAGLHWEKLTEGEKAVVVSYGPNVLVLQKIIEEEKLPIALINARCLKPIDGETVFELLKKECPVLVIEQDVQCGTLYDRIIEKKEQLGFGGKILSLGLPVGAKVPVGKEKDLRAKFGFSQEELAQALNGLLKD